MRKIFPALIAGVAIAMAAGPAGASIACTSVSLTEGTEVIESFGPGTCYDFSFTGPVWLDIAFGAASGDTWSVHGTNTEGYNETTPYTPSTDVNVDYGGGGTWTIYVSLIGAADPYGGFELTNLSLDLPIPTGLTATPLPSTWMMLIAGFAGLGFFGYRGSKKSGIAVATA